jgi:DNA ligase-1
MVSDSFNSLKTFAEVCERVKATASKNLKIEILSEYLKKLDDTSLRIACSLLSGEIFPPWQIIELQVGYSTLVGILTELSGKDRRTLEKVFLRYGDLGETAEDILTKKSIAPLFSEEYTLISFHDRLTKIAEMTGKGSHSEKKKALSGLYLNMSPIESKYLTKILTGEMRIGLVAGLVIEGITAAFGQKFDEVNEAYLLTYDIGETTILAKCNNLKDAKLEPLHQTNFMLAEAMQTPEEIEEYFEKPMICEYKLDGIRAQCHKKGDIVKIFTRRGNESGNSFPEIVQALSKITHDFIIDGEIVAFDKGKILPFSLLQHRIQRKVITRKVVNEVPLTIFVYDILFLDGESVYKKTLLKRKEALIKLQLSEKLKMLAYSFVSKKEEIEAKFNESIERGYEGLMIKDPDSIYMVGKRGKNWVKLKKELDTLDVVVVASERGHGRRANVFSDCVFSVWDNGELKTIGKAYSGLTDKELSEINEKLKEITVKDEGWRIVVHNHFHACYSFGFH